MPRRRDNPAHRARCVVRLLACRFPRRTSLAGDHRPPLKRNRHALINKPHPKPGKRDHHSAAPRQEPPSGRSQCGNLALNRKIDLLDDESHGLHPLAPDRRRQRSRDSLEWRSGMAFRVVRLESLTYFRTGSDIKRSNRPSRSALAGSCCRMARLRKTTASNRRPSCSARSASSSASRIGCVRSLSFW